MIFCGIGNNGGDGLAVARLLKEKAYQVELYVIRADGSESADFKLNLDRLPGLLEIKDIADIQDFPPIPPGAVVIDAIFGSGLTRAVTGLFGNLIDHINSSEANILSIDIASGLFCDQPKIPEAQVIEADMTVSFQLPKLAFLMAENQKNVGDWSTADIGLDEGFIEQADSRYFVMKDNWIGSMLNTRTRHSHKGDYGKALLIEGSLGKMGAAILSGRASLRAGVGLLTLHIPGCGYHIIQTALPEAMVSLDRGQDFLETLPEHLEPYQAIGIGPGIDTNSQTREMLARLLSKISVPLILDADALNILSLQPKLIKDLPPGSILTPHLKEFERLVGPSDNGFHRLEQQLEFSKKHNCYLVLKGAYSSVATPDGQVYFNSTGNPGMATAGAGDVLTGIITSLAAQGYAPFEAAVIGVFLHGLAGDHARDLKGEESLIASDIIETFRWHMEICDHNNPNSSFNSSESSLKSLKGIKEIG